jgi:hypothetical protein
MLLPQCNLEKYKIIRYGLRKANETGTKLVMVGITTQYITQVLRVLHLTLQQSYHLQL